MPISWRPTAKRFETWLRGLPKPVNFSLALILLFAVWRLDHMTGTQVSMSVFYLIPISFAAWFCGSSYGYALAVLSSAGWLEADLSLSHHYSSWLIPLWNSFVRFTFFIIVTALTAVITRLRSLNELEHAAKQEAEQASQLKSNMLSFVSHEIGNSLAVLTMSLYHLRQTEQEPVSEDRESCYQMTKRVVAQLSNTVANFLNAARLESGRFTPNFRRTLIRDLVHETVAALRPLIDQKGTRLILDFPAQPLPVRADPDALSLVMTNLIGNAFKYTPKNGAVTVKIAASNDAASKVLVSVEDTGIGISDEDQKRLFAGFFRTAPGQETAKGYGVGLKVAHDLLESQGARLELESVPGKGSRFFFHLAPWMGKTVPAPSGRSS